MIQKREREERDSRTSMLKRGEEKGERGRDNMIGKA
jgi:hypothetical protein